MRATSEEIKRRYPSMQVTWELLSYDAPGLIKLEMMDGRQQEFNCEHYSKYELQTIIDEWQYEHQIRWMREKNMNDAEGAE